MVNYILQVLNNDKDVHLRFLTATNKPGIYTWPQDEDTSWQTAHDIIGPLSAPRLLPGRGILMQFDKDELEKCRSLI